MQLLRHGSLRDPCCMCPGLCWQQLSRHSAENSSLRQQAVCCFQEALAISTPQLDRSRTAGMTLSCPLWQPAEL